MTRPLISCFLSGLVALGCREERAGVERIERDSAGVHIVEFTFPPTRAARVELRELIRIGEADGADDFIFSRVVGGGRRDDGSFVGAGQGTSEVRVFSPTGDLLRRHGREGQGPGEYEYIRAVGRCSASGFSVFDLHWAVSEYDRTGSFLSERPLRLSDLSTPYALACSRLGRLAVTNWDVSSFGAIGVYEAMAHLRLLDSTGTEAHDLGVRIGSQRFGTETGSGPHPFGSSTHVAFDGEDLIVADGSFFGYEQWSPRGELLQIVRLKVSPPDLDSLIDAYVAHGVAQAEGDERQRRVREFGESLRSLRTASHFADMRVLGGRVLVQVHAAAPGTGPWFAFDQDGTPLGRLPLPEGVRLLDVVDDRLLATQLGEFDVPQVVLYDARWRE